PNGRMAPQETQRHDVETAPPPLHGRQMDDHGREPHSVQPGHGHGLPVPAPVSDPQPMDTPDATPRANDVNLWRAGCMETCTSGSGGRSGETGWQQCQNRAPGRPHWGKLARQDIWLKVDQTWRVEARRGDGDSKIWSHDFPTESEALAAIAAMMDR